MIKKIMLIVLVLEAALMAHAGVGSVSGLQAGLTHPLHGSDHIVTMLAVGFWASQMGGRALWAVPVSFMSMLSVGAIVGLQGIQVPLVEEVILASVIVLGAFIAFGIKLPIGVGSFIAGVFAIFHGYAHGAEMPMNTDGLAYEIGFILATGMLHISGIALAIGIRKTSQLKMTGKEYV